MPKQVIDTPLLMKPIAHFSHAVRVGSLLHVGATAGTDAARRLAGASAGLVDVVAQTEQMFDNLETVLGLLGGSATDLVRMKVYLTDLRDAGRYKEVFARRYGTLGLSPALVGSFGFPLPQAAIELDAIAVVGARPRPVAAYGLNAATAADGRCFLTAQPLDPAGNRVAGDATAQGEGALAHLSTLIQAAGMTRRDVVSLHLTVADVHDAPAIERAIGAAFRAPYPCGTLVVAPLSDPAMKVQIEAVCCAGGGEPVSAPEATTALTWASAAMLVGDELHISGQTGVRRDGAGDDSVEAQTRRAWSAVRALLREAGMRTDDVLRTNNVLTDWRHYAGFNAGYGASIGAPYPPRATVLGALTVPGASVQVEAVAHRRADDSTIVDVSR
jgi:2-iminobutanoate/2-iminopropanoate deaminase